MRAVRLYMYFGSSRRPPLLNVLIIDFQRSGDDFLNICFIYCRFVQEQSDIYVDTSRYDVIIISLLCYY